jgi:hypothetical protein
MWPSDEVIRTREELAQQIRALKDLPSMAKLYDCDITRPAADRRADALPPQEAPRDERIIEGRGKWIAPAPGDSRRRACQLQPSASVTMRRWL